MRSISVVIPNYNGRYLLEVGLPAVEKALAHIGVDAEIIVADDASTDSSVVFLREHYPNVIVIENGTNQGFSVTINSGFRAATKDLVLALNSDVILDEEYFKDQLPLFDDPLLFGTNGSIWERRRDGETERRRDGKTERRRDGKTERRRDGKTERRRDGETERRRDGETERRKDGETERRRDGETERRLIDGAKLPIYNGIFFSSTANVCYPSEPFKPIPTFFLSGANALVDRKKLNELGGMNEIYSPFYMEDVDLSVRAWRMSWTCLYVPSSTCLHIRSSTINAISTARRVRIISRCNKMLFHLFHLNGVPLHRYQCFLAVNFALRWVTLDRHWYTAFLRMWGLLPRLCSEKAVFETKQPKNMINVLKEILMGLPVQGRQQF